MEITSKPGAAPSYLARLLDVIELVGEGPELTLGELSQQAGIPVSTAHRLTGLLLERDFIRRDGGSRLAAGPALLRLSLRALDRLRDGGHLDEDVRALSAATRESVSLGLVMGSQIVLLSRQESPHPLRMVVRVGDVIPPHRSAMGKAILAHAGDRRCRALLAGLEDIAPRLQPELALVRERGYALDDGVFAVGLRCVGAPIFDGNGEVAGAISVAGPSARFSDEAALGCVPALLASTKEVSRRLGYDG